MSVTDISKAREHLTAAEALLDRAENAVANGDYGRAEACATVAAAHSGVAGVFTALQMIRNAPPLTPRPGRGW